MKAPTDNEVDVTLFLWVFFPFTQFDWALRTHILLLVNETGLKPVLFRFFTTNFNFFIFLSQNGASAAGVGKHSIARPEMGYFCFDVLYSHLYQLDPPRVPAFTNDQ